LQREDQLVSSIQKTIS